MRLLLCFYVVDVFIVCECKETLLNQSHQNYIISGKLNNCHDASLLMYIADYFDFDNLVLAASIYSLKTQYLYFLFAKTWWSSAWRE